MEREEEGGRQRDPSRRTRIRTRPEGSLAYELEHEQSSDRVQRDVERVEADDPESARVTTPRARALRRLCTVPRWVGNRQHFCYTGFCH